MTNIILNALEKRKRDLEKISGSKWEHNDNFVLAVWGKYCEGKISAERLLKIFNGRTFKAIEDKVYRIRGRSEKEKKDPNQLSLPLGGELNGYTRI